MDPYQKSRRERRRERERVARRYAVAGDAVVVALVPLFLLHRMSKDCAPSLFGWDEHRRCALPDIWGWLWTAAIAAVVAIAGWLSGDGD
jgi:hypothetical protein